MVRALLARRRSILVEHNPKYWREAPLIDSGVFRAIGGDNVAWSAMPKATSIV